MNALSGGSTKRSTSTCAVVSSANTSGDSSSHRSHRRRGRACVRRRPAPSVLVPETTSFPRRPRGAHYRRSRTSRWRDILPMKISDQMPDAPAPHEASGNDDRLTRFLLPEAGVRGVRVHLDATWRQIRDRVATSEQGPYPASIARLLGEATAAAALFTGHAKVDGRLSVQLRGHGALRTLFAECTAAGTLRGIAQFDDEQPAPAGPGRPRARSDPGDHHREPDPARPRPPALPGPGAAGRRHDADGVRGLLPPVRAVAHAAAARRRRHQRRGPDAAEAARRLGRRRRLDAGLRPVRHPHGRRNCSNSRRPPCSTACSTRRPRSCWPTSPCASPVPARASGWRRCCSPWAGRRPGGRGRRDRAGALRVLWAGLSPSRRPRSRGCSPCGSAPMPAPERMQ